MPKNGRANGNWHPMFVLDVLKNMFVHCAVEGLRPWLCSEFEDHDCEGLRVFLLKI